jgi:hypothetical protein
VPDHLFSALGITFGSVFASGLNNNNNNNNNNNHHPTPLKLLLCCSGAARLAAFLRYHSPMASVKHLFIITAITCKSSTRTWRPMCWSNQAKPSQLFTHSPSSFSSPRQYLCDALYHRQCTISSYRSDDTCAMSLFLLTCAFALPLKLTIVTEPIQHTDMLTSCSRSSILLCQN